MRPVKAPVRIFLKLDSAMPSMVPRNMPIMPPTNRESINCCTAVRGTDVQLPFTHVAR
jgi:hypothetical protein